jgi:hypothetical protein
MPRLDILRVACPAGIGDPITLVNSLMMRAMSYLAKPQVTRYETAISIFEKFLKLLGCIITYKMHPYLPTPCAFHCGQPRWQCVTDNPGNPFSFAALIFAALCIKYCNAHLAIKHWQFLKT